MIRKKNDPMLFLHICMTISTFISNSWKDVPDLIEYIELDICSRIVLIIVSKYTSLIFRQKQTSTLEQLQRDEKWRHEGVIWYDLEVKLLCTLKCPFISCCSSVHSPSGVQVSGTEAPSALAASNYYSGCGIKFRISFCTGWINSLFQ